MPEYTEYVLRGNTITRVTRVEEAMVNLEALLPALTSYMPLSLSPIPNGMKYIRVSPEADGNLKANVLIQHDPEYVRINFKNARAGTPATPVNYRLAMPYGIFHFILNGIKERGAGGERNIWTPRRWGYYWSKDPFSDLDRTMVQGAGMPNCYADGRVCFGTTAVPTTEHFGHFIDAAINTFWTSEFNLDVTPPMPYQTLAEWETAGANNPDIWRTWSIWNAGTPLRRSLEALGNGEWPDAVPSTMDATPIPPIRGLATFAEANRWLDDQNETDRERLIAAVLARTA